MAEQPQFPPADGEVVYLGAGEGEVFINFQLKNNYNI
jgi:hypothetical protein